jgi:hypothetical protein
MADQESPFNLDYQFYLYLKNAGIDPREMEFGRYGDLKRTFYGALGQMMGLYMNNIPKLPQEEAMVEIMWMKDQITKFWEGEVERHFAVKN